MYKKLFLSVFVLSFLSLVSMAQSGGSYQIQKFVIPSGETMAGGNYTLEVTAGQTSIGPRPIGGCYTLDAGFWVPELVPTAANVSVSGRVMTSTGAGLSNAIITIDGADGEIHTARSGSLGYYAFDGIEAGRAYLITVTSKSHEFVPRTVAIVDNVFDLDFTALP